MREIMEPLLLAHERLGELLERLRGRFLTEEFKQVLICYNLLGVAIERMQDRRKMDELWEKAKGGE